MHLIRPPVSPVPTCSYSSTVSHSARDDSPTTSHSVLARTHQRPPVILTSSLYLWPEASTSPQPSRLLRAARLPRLRQRRSVATRRQRYCFSAWVASARDSRCPPARDALLPLETMSAIMTTRRSSSFNGRMTSFFLVIGTILATGDSLKLGEHIGCISPWTIINPLYCKVNYSATSNNMKLIHCPSMGGLLYLV